MKLYIACFCVCAVLLLQSCIKDAPPDPEADIVTFTIDSSLTTGNVFIDQANRKILLYLKTKAYETGLVPVITVSPGATLSPASGDSIHFDKDIQYTVTSQSKAYQKTYTVQVVSVGNWYFNFENWGQNSTDKYQYPIEPDGSVIWSSGNPGVALSGVNKDPQSYPLRATTDGYQGSMGADLVTLAGTPLSNLVGIKLFAGSLFLGVFNSQNAFTNPLGATQFGQPFKGRPARFTGYYKYTPGPDFQDKNGNIIPGMSDSCNIYAVLFKGQDRLDGTNVLTSNKIIATAILPEGSAKSNFTRFDIPFQYIPNADLSGDLMLTIVASSSKNGDTYRGAINSHLVVDSLRIINQ